MEKIRAKDLFMLWIKNKLDERMKDIKCPECNNIARAKGLCTICYHKRKKTKKCE
ncbi:MAG: hypothetical protein KAJ44_05485 [Thermoplasmatales archaeon]|nr:hypothetical protein [Thermoplasmatales archaeon]